MDILDIPFVPEDCGFTHIGNGHYKLGDFTMVRLQPDRWMYMMGFGVHPSLHIATLRDAVRLFQARKVVAVEPYLNQIKRGLKINHFLQNV